MIASIGATVVFVSACLGIVADASSNLGTFRQHMTLLRTSQQVTGMLRKSSGNATGSDKSRSKGSA
jgi:TPP-dependent pyruvate/acetoin dehydrogenase alpha subunit